jgi:hypothetical protein
MTKKVIQIKNFKNVPVKNPIKDPKAAMKA